jgi:hypothetical protein
MAFTCRQIKPQFVGAMCIADILADILGRMAPVHHFFVLIITGMTTVGKSAADPNQFHVTSIRKESHPVSVLFCISMKS